MVITHPLPLQITLLPLEPAPFATFLEQLLRLPLVQVGFDKKNHYEPVRRVGKGSHAVVYESMDLHRETRVAIRCFRIHKVCKNKVYTVRLPPSRNRFYKRWNCSTN